MLDELKKLPQEKQARWLDGYANSVKEVSGYTYFRVDGENVMEDMFTRSLSAARENLSSAREYNLVLSYFWQGKIAAMEQFKNLIMED